MLLSFLGLLLASLGSADARAGAAHANWTTLSNCQFLPNPANDGDSFHLRCNGREYIFRLYFVDAPETDDSIPERVTEQAAYFRIPKQSALAVGELAKQFTASQLGYLRPVVVITRWEDAKGRSRLPRFYAIVRVGGRDLGEALVENGLARVYGARAQLPDGTTPANERAKLRNLERQAKVSRRGAWAYATNLPISPQSAQSKTLTRNPAPTAVKTNQVKAATTTSTNDTQTEQYRISAEGIRHNSNCRHFNGITTTPCGPNDGRPCKICGG